MDSPKKEKPHATKKIKMRDKEFPQAAQSQRPGKWREVLRGLNKPLTIVLLVRRRSFHARNLLGLLFCYDLFSWRWSLGE